MKFGSCDDSKAQSKKKNNIDRSEVKETTPSQIDDFAFVRVLFRILLSALFLLVIGVFRHLVGDISGNLLMILRSTTTIVNEKTTQKTKKPQS